MYKPDFPKLAEKLSVIRTDSDRHENRQTEKKSQKIHFIMEKDQDNEGNDVRWWRIAMPNLSDKLNQKESSKN
jgi:hypothetical protein